MARIYYYIAYYNPRLLEKGKCYNEKYEKIKWVNSKNALEAWKSGKTGFPVVDSNDRNNTLDMHNRARLISSNFLNRMLAQIGGKAKNISHKH